jgi:nucleoside-diphosphate-sugar epimerase
MKVIITGTTGMIGEGILLECLADNRITEVLSVSRKPSGKSHPKLKEYVVYDFLALNEGDEMLQGYDACFFCAGISSVGIDEKNYERITYDTTLHFAKTLKPNPTLSFIYVSGSGTDSSEKGRLHWARVKGKTENDLMKLPFKQAFGFRIGIVKPTNGQNHVLKFYNYLSWLMPLFKILFPGFFNTMKQVANAMIHVSQNGFERNVIFVKDIHHMSTLKST